MKQNEEILKEFDERFPILYRDEYETGSAEFVEDNVRKFIQQALEAKDREKERAVEEFRKAIKMRTKSPNELIKKEYSDKMMAHEDTAQMLVLLSAGYNTAVEQLKEKVKLFLQSKKEGKE